MSERNATSDPLNVCSMSFIITVTQINQHEISSFKWIGIDIDAIINK